MVGWVFPASVLQGGFLVPRSVVEVAVVIGDLVPVQPVDRHARARRRGMSRASTAGVWQAANVKLKTVTIDTDTTVHTLYGRQMGGRKSYNPKNKGKKSYQPRLTFLAETREYLAGEFTRRRSGRRSVSMRLLSSGRLGRASTNKGSTQSDLIKETNMNFPIYDALLDAGASEEKAKIAAVSIPEGQYLASKEDLLKAFWRGQGRDRQFARRGQNRDHSPTC